MSKVSFVDDNLILGDCYIKRDYAALREMILNNEFDATESLVEEGELFGFHVTKNVPVSTIYNMDCYVVKFVFSGVSQLHDDRQEEILKQLLSGVNNFILSHPGYYNLRVPTHIVDLLKAVNSVFSNIMFCGGTVEEIVHGKSVDHCNRNGLIIDFADREYIEKYKTELMDMTLESFKSYQGQYHISNVTQNKAGLIYEQWIKNTMDSLETEHVIIARKDDIPIGFVTIKETNQAVEGILSAVNPMYRKLGAYKAMIAYLINYANQNKKSFVTSTQFDNYIVQGVWNSLGLKPFYSIYNLHIDNRKQDKDIGRVGEK